jgi:xanthine dehydrogenase YagR molybdenum-binding subunit
LDGNVVARSSGKKMSFRDACTYLTSGEIKVTATGRGGGGSPGAQLIEVEVDTETGAIYPMKVVAMQSCGRVVNELTAESQVIGGIIMGIGYALTEERIVDPQKALVLNASLETYKLPGPLEMPEFVVRMVPLGDTVIGVGEPPHIPTAPALANAVYNATGWRVRDIPMTKMRVLRAKQAAERGA